MQNSKVLNWGNPPTGTYSAPVYLGCSGRCSDRRNCT